MKRRASDRGPARKGKRPEAATRGDPGQYYDEGTSERDPAPATGTHLCERGVARSSCLESRSQKTNVDTP